MDSLLFQLKLCFLVVVAVDAQANCITDSTKWQGLVNHTKTGLECQRWDSDTPHNHVYHNDTFAGGQNEHEAENYCRDPRGEGNPWCYTTNPNVRWQYCNTPYCTGTYNVALGKTASQSSNYKPSQDHAPTAVDGNVGNGVMASGSCFHTMSEYQPWWRVDLHQDYYITSVVVYNRLDHCCAERARNIKLTIGKSLDSMSQAGYLDGGLTIHTFTVDPPLVGRFVQLQLNGITEFLHLCEVEVMAYPSGTYNVALGKTASQSSNLNNSRNLAPTAVDGDVGNYEMASGSCFHTKTEYQPWWRVDLHQDFYITSVVVYNRLDQAQRARNISLTIGKSLDSMSQAGYLDGGFTTTHTFTVDPSLVGRFVQLQLKGIKECFHLCEIEVIAYPSDNIAQIEFQRISDNQQYTPQSVTEILVDHLSNDTFRIMCTLNNTTNMKTFGFLIMWQGAYSLIGEMHNVEPSITEIYKNPGSYSNGSSWTDVGRFDNVTSISRHLTLGVSRPLSSMTCSDAGVYSCDVGYINSSSIMVFHTGTIRKELKLQVTPSKITKRIFNASNDEGGIISELTNSTPIVHVGQKLRLQCTAITGTFNTSVQIVWMKRSLENGSNLAPFSSDKHIIGEPKAIGMCEFEKTDSIIYDVTKEDAERTPENSLHFQCYVHIMSIDWKTPEQQRRNFSFVVHLNDGSNDFQNDTNEINAYDSVDGNDENSGGLNTTTAKDSNEENSDIKNETSETNAYDSVDGNDENSGGLNTTTAKDEKSAETSRNPDAPVDTVPSARDSEIYTEIGETSDRQGNCRRTGESSFTVQTIDLLHNKEFGAGVSKPYTELDNPIYENIRK